MILTLVNIITYQDYVYISMIYYKQVTTTNAVFYMPVGGDVTLKKQRYGLVFALTYSLMPVNCNAHE